MIVGACVIAGVSALMLWRGSEPRYGGKTLREWLEWPSPGLRTTYTMPDASRDALRNIGTNALPCLLEWLAYERPRWRDKAVHAYEKLPSGLHSRAVENWLDNQAVEKKAHLGILGFEILGPDAAPAVSGLMRLLKESRSARRSQNVMCCLRWVGRGARCALPELGAIVADRQSGLRADAALTMEMIEPGSVRRFVADVAANPAEK